MVLGLCLVCVVDIFLAVLVVIWTLHVSDARYHAVTHPESLVRETDLAKVTWLSGTEIRLT